MNVKLYTEFIDELINNGVKVENLSLNQIKDSLNLYKLIKGGNENVYAR